MVANACVSEYTKISSGNLAEGLDLPGSDIDIMYVNNCIDVILNASNIKHPIHRTTLVMETAIGHPGFVRLKCKAVGVSVRQKNSTKNYHHQTQKVKRTTYSYVIINFYKTASRQMQCVVGCYHYYVTRQYNATLKLTEYVLSRYSPDMIYLHTIINADSVNSFYKHNLHSTMILNEKMTIFTVDDVEYLPNS
ncbi:unnamed protein product [Mytilus coruscus]|uniref:Uncharacterized protein n=1 Tax=Mytilus coruscus TaxID=42192 RepID=A0A6J8ATJ2_MYTCO|nr:unnamed protein product [Mytilus coruscus]